MLKKYADFDIQGFGKVLLKIFSSGMLCGAGAFLVYNGLSDYGNNVVSTLSACLFGGIIYILSTYFTGIITKSTLKMLIS